ncbi:MAG: hypothetical protein U0X92_01680 [Anaerolineales bacterium]
MRAIVFVDEDIAEIAKMAQSVTTRARPICLLPSYSPPKDE